MKTTRWLIVLMAVTGFGLASSARERSSSSSRPRGAPASSKQSASSYQTGRNASSSSRPSAPRSQMAAQPRSAHVPSPKTPYRMPAPRVSQPFSSSVSRQQSRPAPSVSTPPQRPAPSANRDPGSRIFSGTRADRTEPRQHSRPVPSANRDPGSRIFSGTRTAPSQRSDQRSESPSPASVRSVPQTPSVSRPDSRTRSDTPRRITLDKRNGIRRGNDRPLRGESRTHLPERFASIQRNDRASPLSLRAPDGLSDSRTPRLTPRRESVRGRPESRLRNVRPTPFRAPPRVYRPSPHRHPTARYRHRSPYVFDPWTFRHHHRGFSHIVYRPVPIYAASGMSFFWSSGAFALGFSTYSWPSYGYTYTRYYDSWHDGYWGYSNLYLGGWRNGWYGGFSYIYNPWPVYRTYYFYEPAPVVTRVETVYVEQAAPATVTATTTSSATVAPPATSAVEEPVGAWAEAPAPERVEAQSYRCFCACGCNGTRPCFCDYPCGAEYEDITTRTDLRLGYVSYAESLNPEAIWASYAGLDYATDEVYDQPDTETAAYSDRDLL